MEVLHGGGSKQPGLDTEAVAGEHARPMTRRSAVAALAVAGALGCSAVTTAIAAEEVPTTVTGFSWTDADGETDFFDGHIASVENKCIKHRTLTVFRKRHGPDSRVGRTETDNTGKWKVEREDPGSGHYYVKVKEAKAGGLVCQRAKAGTLRVVDLEDV